MVDAVVLAAGSSTRMGRPKLLLALDGRGLVRRVVDETLASRVRQTLVVTGAHREAVEAELAGLPVRLVYNPDHTRGMSTSLRAGLDALPPDAEAVVVLLADQPLVDHSIVDALIAERERTGATIVRPSYGGQPGNPVLWDRTLYGELRAQDGDRGGRELLRLRAGETAHVEIADRRAGQDVDTPAEYQALVDALAHAASDHGHVDAGASFCPRCGGRLEARIVQDRSRPVCVACDSVFWIDPKVAVAVLIPWHGGVLLGRRAIDPGMGLWSFPSGYVDRGEMLEAAARREVFEETGLDVDITGLVGAYSTAGHPVILVVYAGEPRLGAGAPPDPRPGPEMSELTAFAVDRLPPMAFDHDDRILDDWLALRRRQAVGG